MGIESFSFSPDGSYLALRRYAPETREPAAGADTPASPTEDAVTPGTMLVLRELATGLDATFGSVSELAWQDDTLLAPSYSRPSDSLPAVG